MRTPGSGRAAAAVDRRRGAAAPRAAGACSTRTSSSRPTASARSRASIATSPYVLDVDGSEHRVDYEPGESTTGLFGGNSNWRGPIWFPVNYLLIESLQKFHHYYGDDFKVECPTGSGSMMTLGEVAAEILAPPDAHLPARRRRAAGRCSATIETLPARSALARPDPVLRVLPRRQRPRRRRQPSDRLDRPRRQAAAAERRARRDRAGRGTRIATVGIV